MSTFGSGGAERVITIIANHWAANDQQVTLITLVPTKTHHYALHAQVKRTELDLLGNSRNTVTAVWNNAQRLKWLRNAIRASTPDVVISFIDTTNVLTLLACVGLRIPVIVSERSHPDYHPIGSAWTRLRSLVYRHADGIVVQSHGLRDWARGFVKDDAVHIIPNPVKPVLNGYPSHRQGSGRTIVAMGRLASEKRFDLLLRAFCQCAKAHADWSLILIGEGEERRSLETLTRELGLEDRVKFPGLVPDPTSILHGADVFVLSSSYEGFPNALLEAMACGLAVISTDCGSGPREIIRNGVNGLLVAPNDGDALAEAMDRLMKDSRQRERLGARATEVLERFGVQKVMDMWDTAVQHVCQRRKV